VTISHREYHDVAKGKRSGFNSRYPKPKLQVPERHKRKCLICKHRRREKIEAAFLEWQSLATIASEFGLSGRHAIYRHAHATGLYQIRRLKFRCAVDMVIEDGGSHHGYDALLRAVCAGSLMDASGKRNPPSPRVVIISNDPSATGSNPVQLIQIEPDLAVELTKTGVRLPSNRHLLVRFETSANV
jgi:hypothetical protein